MPHILPATNRTKGLTIIETLIVVSTLSVLIAGLFYAMQVGESSWSFNVAEREVQSEVRRAADWIANDVRQARRVDIGSGDNNPSNSHIKFKKVIGYDTTGSGQATLSNDFYEYTYNSDLQTITRTDLGANQSWVFRYIIEAPFYTNNSGNVIVIDPLGPGLDSPVFQTGNLVIKLSGQKQVKSGSNAAYALTEEIKIRN